MDILGISAFYHDSAAALVRDGRIVAAAQEERFTRRKHDSGFPAEACRYCLEHAGIGAADLDFVVFYEKPLLKFDRLLETYFSYAPRGFWSFREALPLWLKEKLFLPRQLDRGLGGSYRGRYAFMEHHESHAASAFFPSPFEEAAILTVDGVGEWSTATIGVGRGNRIELKEEIRFPHSLGLLYSAFTYYCGFKVNSGEYKLMGLAPYGVPRFADVIRKQMVSIRDDGSFWMDMRYFNYCQGLTMTSEAFHRLFGAPPRRPEAPLDEHYMDVAASVQQVTEEILLKMAVHACEVTSLDRLCMAGGVALNCVANGRILRESPFRDVWVQPAAGDAGGALGAALFVWHQLLAQPRLPDPLDAQQGSLLGPAFSNGEIVKILRNQNAVFHRLSGGELDQRVAGFISEGKVVGWFQGRMEFGPRALGSRSILGDSRSAEMQRTMNLKIKYRESFRPFAPAVLAERTGDFFDLNGFPSPYMLMVATVSPARRTSTEQAVQQAAGFDKLYIPRSEIPAVTHVDFSARIQTVDSARFPRFHRLLREVENRTGCPVIINTSFNVRGEPIVCTPADAYRCFMATGMDALAMEDVLLLKHEQPEENRVERERHLERFGLD
jgi:carbamoyltransferase